jgi:Fe-S cluster assembly protein SufD
MEAIARANDLYDASLASFEEQRSGGEPDWLVRLRREAFARFAALGFPTTKDEAWKYTSVGPIAKTSFRPATEAPVSLSPREREGLRARPEPQQLVFVNGRYAPDLSGQPPANVLVRSLREALREEPDAIEPHLGRHADFQKSVFTALNTALFEDGVFIRIPRGTVIEEPIDLLFLSAPPDGQATVSHPRVLVVAEPNSQATIVETYIGEDALNQSPHPAPLPGGEGEKYFTNSVTEIVCGEGAVVEHYKVQREGLSAFHVQTVQAVQAGASNFASHNICLGAALARTDINVLFAAEGSECTLNGLFLPGGTQHMDNHTLIDHAKPRCTSRELYKGILDGRSRGVFHGKIIVRPDAQKTDAVQTNKNLLLSREALVNSTPALEILADDVKCRHGSTIGQLDANSLFYLRSRGIGEREARALLTYGFAADLARRIRVPWIREEIEAYLGLRLPQPVEAS